MKGGPSLRLAVSGSPSPDLVLHLEEIGPCHNNQSASGETQLVEEGARMGDGVYQVRRIRPGASDR